ncbi:YraN family protein [Halopseudomonas pachastrellae]|uniref:YraN family protein n=1 Tax=Halopseudomonas pachastrellae TaxID=254161 RepID=UPI003D7EE123
MTSRQKTGNQAERMAEQILRQAGLSCLARNHRCRQGELDLVMRDGDTVVFVEVRYRQQDRWGSAAESVGRSKQQRVIRAAEHFLLTHPRLANRPCRFDVVAAEGNPADPSSYTWIREAFTC